VTCAAGRGLVKTSTVILEAGRSRLVSALPDAERELAAAAVAHCATVALPRGTARSADRLPPAELLHVEQGLVARTSARRGSSRRMIVALSGPGTLLLPPATDERLEALEDAALLALDARARRSLLVLPGGAELLLSGLEEGLRTAQESLAQLASVRHVERVRDKLLQLAREHGRVVPGGVRLDLPLTHELIGEMVGSARETVTWALAQLQREGFVRREGRSYRLAVSPEALVS
jgi:CRP-like cAMP-binding protein